MEGLLTSSSRTEGKNGHENQRAQCRRSRLSESTALYKRGAAGLKVRETEETRTMDASPASLRTACLAPPLSPYWLSPTRNLPRELDGIPQVRPPGCESVQTGRSQVWRAGRKIPVTEGEHRTAKALKAGWCRPIDSGELCAGIWF